MDTKTPLTPSEPSVNQVEKVCDRLMVAARKSGIPLAQFQVALGFPGTGLEDDLAAVFVKYAKKASGIVTPVRAEDTGLIPQSWKVKKGGDRPEGDVDLAKLDYSTCPVRKDEEYVSGETMMKRARELGAIGSLGFAAELLKAQDEGKEIFPVESRGVHYFIMPLTELQDVDGNGGVAYFRWPGERWGLDFRWLLFRWLGRFSRCGRFVRRSDYLLATTSVGASF